MHGDVSPLCLVKFGEILKGGERRQPLARRGILSDALAGGLFDMLRREPQPLNFGTDAFNF